MTNRVVYTSDMHGNEAQFRAFVDCILEVKPSIAIIGGDIPPNGSGFARDDYIVMQRKFLTQRLPELLKPIKQVLPETQIYVIPGNDDCKVNDDIFNTYPQLLTNVDGKRIKLPGGFREIVGYSVVPITPFRIKDREKYDLTNIPEEVVVEYAKRQRGYNLQGIVSVGDRQNARWQGIQFREEDKTDSIQKDLEGVLFISNSRNSVYIFHTPPNNTPLDITKDGKHVGSFAIRYFIEKYQPFLTLHGHIHETVDMSKEYKTKIGDSWCMSAGNHNRDSKLAVLTFDLDNPADAERVKLPCTAFSRLIKRTFRR
ncbi:MAG: metallophosphoesterase [Nanoarchaeota archaeon]|nr:metallophosphoesterase [Nanoarchaeota archaeon]